MARWTPEEDELLREGYGNVPIADLAEKLGRKKHVLHSRVSAKFPELRTRRPWTDEETARLIELNDEHDAAELAAILDRSPRAVMRRRVDLGLRPKTAWSDDELATLREFYPLGVAAAEARIDKSRYAIMRMARKLGLRVEKWAPEEDFLLRRCYGTMTGPELAGVLGRSLHCIYARAQKLGLNAPLTRWTAEEDDLLRKYYAIMLGTELAEKLGRSLSAVRIRAKRLGLKAKRGRPELDWSAEEDDTLRQRYGKVLTKDLAAELGRPVHQVGRRARKLGLSAKRGRPRKT